MTDNNILIWPLFWSLAILLRDQEGERGGESDKRETQWMCDRDFDKSDTHTTRT